ncbi:MAG: glycosyl hydrolase [Capsulimonadaceae bacterium]|nr:glycosyl hydrolase [Capsulimonadaceae bacterium]
MRLVGPRFHRNTPLSVASCGGLAVLAFACSPVNVAASPSRQVPSPLAVSADPLVNAFAAPSLAARPAVRWDWLDGNVSPAGITADLEALSQVGIGEARVALVTGGTPRGAMTLNSKLFASAWKHSVGEAKRLGIDLGLAVTPGTDGAAGAWVKASDAMKTVVSCEVHVKGPVRGPINVGAPIVTDNFYRDIAVVAFPTPSAEAPSMADLHAHISGSNSSVTNDILQGPKGGPFAWLPAPAAAQPQYLQVDFEVPQTIRSFSAQLGPGTTWLAGTFQAGDGSGGYRDVSRFEFRLAPGRPSHTIGVPATTASTFRIVLTGGAGSDRQIAIGRIALLPKASLSDFAAKTLRQSTSEVVSYSIADSGGSSADIIVDPKDIVDLTSRANAAGRVSWDAPRGDWTILRIGYTVTAQTNHLAWKDCAGYECDRLSTRGADAISAGLVALALSADGRDAGKPVADVWLGRDEDFQQNWTDNMRSEFSRRRGYDPLTMMPVLCGHIVTSLDASERFLWDLRRTVSDLRAENFVGRIERICDDRSLKLIVEPGPGPFDVILSAGRTNTPSFTMAPEVSRDEISQIVSGAHIYGRNIIEASIAPSAPNMQARLSSDPLDIKVVADRAFCRGANRINILSFTHQPVETTGPGLIGASPGFQVSRNTPWWREASGVVDYLSRTASILQQGTSVSDVLCYLGEQWTGAQHPPICPVGYRCDECNADTLLNRLSVRDGKIISTGGASYRILALPDEISMRPEVLAAIRSLVEQGATVVGRRPYASPSLQGFPGCDDAVRRMTSELWGDGEEGGSGDRSVGKGKIEWGETLEERLKEIGLQPDFLDRTNAHSPIDWVHRSTSGREVYFLVNREATAVNCECCFRCPNASVELWHADSGVRENAPLYSTDADRTVVPMQFAPYESCFVVLRKDGPQSPHLVNFRDLTFNGPPVKAVVERASWEAVDGSWSTDVTAALQERFDTGRYRTPVIDESFGAEQSPSIPKQLRVAYSVEGASVSALLPSGTLFAPAGIDDDTSGQSYTLHTNGGGGVEVAACKNLVYEMATVDGKRLTGQVDNVSGAAPIDGPWSLSFPPKLGAPAKAAMTQLIPLNAMDDPGIRYFSGTALYEVDVTIAQDVLGPQSDLFLDIGGVRNVADIIINGKRLATIWKPPYQVRITDDVHVGQNHIAIAVTNTWANRLIGDEQLGALEWISRSLNGQDVSVIESWPQWLTSGKANPGPAIAFSTCRLYAKDEPCPQSGLIGPVMLRKIQKVNIPVP